MTKYNLMSEGRAKELQKLKNTVKFWHDEIKPDYIFLNETCATSFGYLFKSAWKEAYPSEPVPKFYRINPRATPHFWGNNKRLNDLANKANMLEKWKQFMLKRINKKNARVVIFDEAFSGGSSNMAVRYTIKDNDKGTAVFTNNVSEQYKNASLL